MTGIIGTSGTDFLRFVGDLQNLTLGLINPDTGDFIEISGDFLVNSSTYDGLSGFDYLILGNVGDALFLDGSSFSNSADTFDRSPTIQNIDYIIAGSGGDIVNLSSYINTLSDIIIDGGDGGDILWTNDGDDVVSGLDGNDHIVTGDGNDHLKGLNDDDYLNGASGADLLDGGNGNDTLLYWADGVWDNTLDTNLYSLVGLNQSHDSFRGGEGFDILKMGDGNDALLITDFISPIQRSASGDRIAGVERVEAGAGDDVIDLANSSIYGEDIEILGEAGNDFIRSGSGNDVLYGGEGSDKLYGGAGNDVLYGGSNTGGIEVQEHLFSSDAYFPVLQERKHVKKLLTQDNPALGIAEGDLSVAYKTTATFTFQESGAGYRNTLGFYRINHLDGTIEGVEVGFANVKDYRPGTGYTVDLPGEPDTDFGFFIIANGFRHNRSYRDMDLEGDHLNFIYKYGTAEERAATIYDDGDDISLIYDDGSLLKVLKGNVYHTTLRDGDTKINRDDADHVVSGLLDSEDRSVLRIGFEDLKNLGDADYNDVVFDLRIEGQTIDTSDAGNDILAGGAGDDILYGEGGHDLLIIGDGLDTAYGGSGHDIFAFDVLDGQVDIIADFNFLGDADILDISDIITGYDPLSSAIEDFVRLSSTPEGDMLLEVHDGANFIAIAQISGGVDGKTLTDMLNDGSLVVQNEFI